MSEQMPGTRLQQGGGDGPIAFVHVPKTAGSSLYSVFRTVLNPSELVKLHPKDDWAGGAIGLLENLSPQRRARVRLVYGHIDVALASRFVPLQRMVTLLRDPVDRTVSNYAFVKHMITGYDHEVAQRLPICEWIDELQLTEMDNGMVRRLCGTGDGVPFGACTSDMLEQAKANLRQFALVGLTSRFDHFYALLARMMDWEMLTYEVAKVNARRPALQQVEDAVLDELRRRNALDIELYRFGEELAARHFAAADVAAEIAAFGARRNNPSLCRKDARRRRLHSTWNKMLHVRRPYRLYG